MSDALSFLQVIWLDCTYLVVVYTNDLRKLPFSLISNKTERWRIRGSHSEKLLCTSNPNYNGVLAKGQAPSLDQATLLVRNTVHSVPEIIQKCSETSEFYQIWLCLCVYSRICWSNHQRFHVTKYLEQVFLVSNF